MLEHSHPKYNGSDVLVLTEIYDFNKIAVGIKEDIVQLMRLFGAISGKCLKQDQSMFGFCFKTTYN